MKAEEQVAVECSVCGATPSLGVCQYCGIEVCEAHAGPVTEDSVVCRQCTYKEALGDVGQHIKKRKKAADETTPDDTEGTSRIRKVIGFVVLVAVLAGIGIVYYPIAFNASAEEESFSFGPGGTEEPGLDDSVQGLWRVRAALDAYLHKSSGKLPPSLDNLEGENLTSCPGCEKPWRYERKGEKGYVVACPDPAAHERMAIYLSHKYGPPQVRLHSEGGSR